MNINDPAVADAIRIAVPIIVIGLVMYGYAIYLAVRETRK